MLSQTQTIQATKKQVVQALQGKLQMIDQPSINTGSNTERNMVSQQQKIIDDKKKPTTNQQQKSSNPFQVF